MLKKVYAIIILALSFSTLKAQYEGLDSSRLSRNQGSNDEYQRSSALSFSEHLQYGLETQIFSLYNGIYLEAYPIAMYNVKNRMYAGIGPHLALVTAAGMVPRAQMQVGAEAFVRLAVESLFIQGEYKWIRAQDPNGLDPQLFQSPIVGIGFIYGKNMASWAMVGLSTQPEMAQISPLGRIVYRVGFCF
ncbi:MAG: hypothetical protein RL577_1439 [Bacteroidota bacterium]